MASMMTTTEAAETLGVPRIIINRAIKKLRMRETLPRNGGQYVLSPTALETICDYLQRRSPTYGNVTVDLPDDDDDGAPALPLEWWGDPAHTAEFVAERFRREARLLAMIRRSGLVAGASEAV